MSTLEEKIKKSYDELMDRFTQVEESTKNAFEIAIKNDADIRSEGEITERRNYRRTSIQCKGRTQGIIQL